MAERSFLILHGLEGSGPEHWQSWLAERLRDAGEHVRYPNLPDPFDPKPEAWEAVLRDELAMLEGERVLLCHSLGCLLWLRHASHAEGREAERVLLVAPPCTDSVAPVVEFRRFEPRPEAIRAAAAQTLVVHSDDDPYCPAGAHATFVEPLGLPGELVPGGGHLNVDAGYGAWPFVEDWALERS